MPMAKRSPLIGIRREDKNRWEVRAPLVPEDVQALREAGLTFHVQTSPLRVFNDEAYVAAGARVVPQLDDCDIVVGIKEMPRALFRAGATYMFFSHTIKAQPANMPMLRQLLDVGATLIDYEKIVDAQGRRLVFFGRYAGLAGMIDTLWALGRRLEHEGIESPFRTVRRAFEYESVAHAKREITAIGHQIRRTGLPDVLRPFICGFAGYGNVSQGAQEIFDLLPTHDVAPQALGGLSGQFAECAKVVFREEHLVKRADGQPFVLADYYAHPEHYRSVFAAQLPYLTALVNGIYWEKKYPRLVTCDDIAALYSGQRVPRLRVIGDISCDVHGSIQCTTHATDPGDPVYVYEPATGNTHAGVVGHGPVILAVDILPCELPRDASRYFSATLRPLLTQLANADLSKPLDRCGLPPELIRATIVHRGKLTPPFAYLADAVAQP